MGRLFDNAYAHHLIVAEDGEYSADAGDYWYLSDTDAFDDAVLIRTDHPWLTTTGRVVLSARIIKSSPTKRDLLRLASAKASLRQSLIEAVDDSGILDEEGKARA